LNITGDSVARCCVVPDSVLPARVNQHVAIIRLKPLEADYKYIFYSLLALKEELLSQAKIGATRRALTKGMIGDLEIMLPPSPNKKQLLQFFPVSTTK
jgi:type I restriction enzyme, S subunit